MTIYIVHVHNYESLDIYVYWQAYNKSTTYSADKTNNWSYSERAIPSKSQNLAK